MLINVFICSASTVFCFFFFSFSFYSASEIDTHLKYVIGIRGKKKLVVDGNTFYRFLVTKQNQTWYCSQRKSKKCRASFRFLPSGKILPVITQHTHETFPINTRIFQTDNANDLYYDSDNHLQIDYYTIRSKDGYDLEN